MKRHNILQAFLAELAVPFTSPFSRDVFGRQPYKYSLYGLMRMLRTYHIETTTLRLNDKADLFQLHPPFIAQVANDLAIVTAVEEQNVTYRWYDTSVCEPLPQFIEKWSGVVLLAAPGDGSKEPDIEQHRQDANWEKRIRTLCVCCATCSRTSAKAGTPPCAAWSTARPTSPPRPSLLRTSA